MTAVEIFGWVCAVVGASSSVPQMIKLWRTKTTAGLSLLMWQFTFAVSVAWTVHGSVVIPNANIVAPNAVMGVFSLWILIQIIKDRGLNPAKAMVIPVSLAAVLIATDLTLGPLVMGVLISIPQLVGAFAQFSELLRRRDLSGVSPVFLVWLFVVQVLWLTWAIWANDIAITLAAGSYGVACLLNLVWFTLRRTEVIGPMGAAHPAELALEDVPAPVI